MRPISTAHATGVVVWLLFAVSVIREVLGSVRYCSFSGLCTDLRSMDASSSFILFFDGPCCSGIEQPNKQPATVLLDHFLSVTSVRTPST